MKAGGWEWWAGEKLADTESVSRGVVSFKLFFSRWFFKV